MCCVLCSVLSVPSTTPPQHQTLGKAVSIPIRGPPEQTVSLKMCGNQSVDRIDQNDMNFFLNDTKRNAQSRIQTSRFCGLRKNQDIESDPNLCCKDVASCTLKDTFHPNL